MIVRMVAWLREHGHVADPANAEAVIWAIDRHYPGGFGRFASESCRHRGTKNRVAARSM